METPFNFSNYSFDMVIVELTGVDLCLANKRIDEFFNELFDGMYTMKYEKYSNFLLFVKKFNGKVVDYMEQDSKKELLWCSYDLVWLFFEDEIGLNDSDIKVLIKERVEEAFNLKVDTPLLSLRYK